MVLVTGPTGPARRTTLYAALSEIKSIEDKIVTIEDPVEYQLRGITQIPINEKKGLTFARGLRSILRHDPDKIMVGEIRDPETAQIAIQSALTGHLVFTTVHANNVVDVLGRFLNMESSRISSYPRSTACWLSGWCGSSARIAKRVARVEQKLLEESALDPALVHNVPVLYEGAGCIECGGTGFKGRTAICELLDLSDRIREIDPRQASQLGREEGRARGRDEVPPRIRRGEGPARADDAARD